MAGKRLAKSAINWEELFKTVAEKELPALRVFKARQDGFIGRVNKYAAEQKKIDFAAYKSKVSNPALVEMFEKEYNALQIPFPKDVENVAARAKVKEEQDMQEAKGITELFSMYIEGAKEYVKQAEQIPHQEQLALDAFKRYFPGLNKDFDLKDRGTMAHNDVSRYNHFFNIPMHHVNYRAQAKDVWDWYTFKGKYAHYLDEMKGGEKKMIKEQPKKEEITAGSEPEAKK